MSERKAKPPIDKKLIGAVENAITYMENKQLALAKQPFTCRDLLDLFIDPEHHHVLTKAYELCEPSGHTQDLFASFLAPAEYGGTITHLRFYWHSLSYKDGFYVPFNQGAVSNHSAVIRDDAPDELKARLRQTVDDLIGIHWRFGEVRKVLVALNKASVCPSLASLRYHWPCIVPILRTAKQNALADSVIEPNSRAGDRANISHELRKKLAPTNQTIAAHQLIEDVPLPPALPVPYELRYGTRR